MSDAASTPSRHKKFRRSILWFLRNCLRSAACTRPDCRFRSANYAASDIRHKSGRPRVSDSMNWPADARPWRGLRGLRCGCRAVRCLPFELDVEWNRFDGNESKPEIEPQRGIVARSDHEPHRNAPRARFVHQHAHDGRSEALAPQLRHDSLIDEVEHAGGAIDHDPSDRLGVKLDDVETGLGKLCAIARGLRLELVAH